MSTQKLNELIKTAPEFKQWWKKNHAQIHTSLKRKRRVGMFVLGASFLAIQGVFALIFFNAPSTMPLNWETLMPLLGGICVALYVVAGGVYHWNRWRGLWPKNCPRPLSSLINPDDLLDLSGAEICTNNPLNRKEILEKVLHNSNPDVRLQAQALLALEDAQMPNMWWRALEILLDEIDEKEEMSHSSCPQELESVSMEIEKNDAVLVPKAFQL